jgi:cytohesin
VSLKRYSLLITRYSLRFACGLCLFLWLLVAFYPDPDAGKPNGGLRPLHRAAALNDLDSLKAIDATELDTRDDLDMTPLHWAAFQDVHEAAAQLIEQGANPMSEDALGMTPLHWAAKHGSLKVLEALMTPEAIAKQDRVGMTPFHWAALFHHPEIIERLAAKDASAINTKEFMRKWTPLQIAAFKGREDVMQVLLKYGARRNDE